MVTKDLKSLIDDEQELLRAHRVIRRPDIFFDRRHENIRFDTKRAATVTVQLDMWLPVLEQETLGEGGHHIVPIGMFRRRRTEMLIRVNGKPVGLLGRRARSEIVLELQLLSCEAAALEAVKGAKDGKGFEKLPSWIADVASSVERELLNPQIETAIRSFIKRIRRHVMPVVAAEHAQFGEELSKLNTVLVQSRKVKSGPMNAAVQLVGAALKHNLPELRGVNQLFVVADVPLGVPFQVSVEYFEENDVRTLRWPVRKSGFELLGLADTRISREATNAGHVESYMMTVERSGGLETALYWEDQHPGQLDTTRWDGPNPTIGWRSLDGTGAATSVESEQHPVASALKAVAYIRVERFGSNLRALILGILSGAAFFLSATSESLLDDNTTTAIVVPSFIASPSLAVGYLFAFKSRVERWTSAFVEVLAFSLAVVGGLIALFALSGRTTAVEVISPLGVLLAWTLVALTLHTLAAPRPLQSVGVSADRSEAKKSENGWAWFTCTVYVLGVLALAFGIWG